MSKYFARIVVASVLVSAAGLALAQKRPVEKAPTRTEVGKVASLEEPDFTRFRVVTGDGILAVFDADEEWDGRDEPASQLAYWNDFASEQLFFFDQLLFTEGDVLQSVAAIPRDLDIDPAQILIDKPEFDPLPEPTGTGTWRIATELDVLAVMSGGNPEAGEGGQVSGLIFPCVPNPNCEPAAAAASGSLPAPIRGTPKEQLFAMAQAGSNCNCGGHGICHQQVCAGDPSCSDGNPCTGPDYRVCYSDCYGPEGVCHAGPPLTGNACADEPNPCTDDVCSAGICVHLPKPDGTTCPDDGDPDTGEVCIGGDCTLDPFRNIHAVADRLMDMEDDLLTNHFDPAISSFTEVTEEVLTSENGSNYATFAPIRLSSDDIERRTGTVSVTTSDGSDSVGLQIATTFDDGLPGANPQWILNQDIQLVGEELRFIGSLEVIDSSGNLMTLTGGWTYSVAAGLVINPSSDAGFQAALADMQGIEPSVVAGGGLSPGATLVFLANVTAMLVNYMRDALIPDAPSWSCDGAVQQNGSGQSCEGVPIPCFSALRAIALTIDSLSDVGPGFKKCMKGRFDCRKSASSRLSRHPRLRINCDDSASCGPCGYEEGATGCNIGGRDMWYCEDGPDTCVCAQTIFHEASHACGALDQLPHDAPYSSYRIGDWFKAECDLLFPSSP